MGSPTACTYSASDKQSKTGLPNSWKTGLVLPTSLHSLFIHTLPPFLCYDSPTTYFCVSYSLRRWCFMSSTPPRFPSSSVMRDMAPFLSVGSQLTITVLMFVALGRWIDSRWSHAPLATGFLGGIGAIIGLVNMIRSLMSLSRSRTQHNEDVSTTSATEK